jgi:hypothetical protein
LTKQLIPVAYLLVCGLANGQGPSPPLTLSVTVIPSVSVVPQEASLLVGGTQPFTANIPVTWSVTPNIGSIDTNGLYRAPATVATTQTLSIVATSVEDPRIFGIAELEVRSGSAITTDTNCDDLAGILTAAGLPPQPWEEPIRKVGNACRLFSPGPARRSQ